VWLSVGATNIKLLIILDYKRIYNNLILRAQNRSLIDYKESHHIIPRCLGGSNDKSNLVELTAEEHYVCHQLLVKIYPDNAKIAFAAKMMTRCSTTQARNNKMYSWLRKRLSAFHKSNMIGNTYATGNKGQPSKRKNRKFGPNPKKKGPAKRLECPHCHRMISVNKFNQYHNDNCKLKT
jgi:hypothetical protein